MSDTCLGLPDGDIIERYRRAAAFSVDRLRRHGKRISYCRRGGAEGAMLHAGDFARGIGRFGDALNCYR